MVLPPFDKKHLLCENLIFAREFFERRLGKIGGYDENLKYGWEDWDFGLIYFIH